MKQPDTASKREFADLAYDNPTRVQIPGTKREVVLKGMKPYTIERMTLLWLEREEMALPQNSAQTLKSLCYEPYFAIKEAVLATLNSYLSIRLFYAIKWRWWAYIKGYTEEQMTPIIQESKKKLPLSAHWINMAFSVDMRNDLMKMTSKEAEQYRAELLSAAKELSLKNSPNTEGQD